MNSNPAFASFTAIALKVVAVILILSSLVDYITLLIPFNPTVTEWQVGFTNAIVDRGIIPMVGIVFLLIGYWISNTVEPIGGGSMFADLRFWAFLLASILGLLFLLLVPLHISNLSNLSADRLTAIDQEASTLEERISLEEERLKNTLNDQAQLDQQLKQLDTIIESGAVQGQELSPEQIQQAEALRQQLLTARENPEALQTELQTEIDKRKTELATQRTELESQAKTEAFKNGIRIGISSFLLAIGYIAIGWTGFKGLGTGSGGRRRVSAK
ncbi:MAG: HpsJ family protein [Jaaginema sp. PMC 1079.18]|nr:HpsJ family protein [Jaaginema sp. PMC 1080.18]MEC4849667.1 HpsJ family protein [Jaaginema sp. PMC 1079.18]MEC4866073.1 HpsJ family protein [Jaaginema sp. PMC 1078.18]